MKIYKILISILFSCLPLFAQSQLIINEIMASNASSHMDTRFYNFEDWIELYNSGTTSIKLSNYYISDDKDELLKWQLPSTNLDAGEYYLIYCDKIAQLNHSNFGLSTDGETVFLSNSEGEIVDNIKYDDQYADISYGRNPSDSKQWFFCAQPTPGEPNLISTATKRAKKVKYSVDAGRQSGSFSLSLEGNEIYYSNNGAEPSKSSNTYSTTLTVSSTSTIKSINYQDGFLPSEIKANTYFVNEHEFTLPVVSISYTPDYFYNQTYGIHVRGNNGTSNYCGDVANWFQNWERPAYFEYFDAEGKKQISQLIGVKIAGGCTRGRDQKSLSLYARSKYGNNDFDYRFFSEKPHIGSYKSLMLRNSGNDQDQTLLRDAFTQGLVSGTMDIDYVAYQPTTVYFNGEYRGIMNIREKTDEDYFLANHNLKSDEIDFIEKENQVIRGTSDDYAELINFVTSNDLSVHTNYQWVADRIDIPEYINYNIIEIYIGNRDWPENNNKYWKEKENGKWRWILFDTDYGFGFRMDNSYHQSFHMVLDNEGMSADEQWSTVLFQNMMKNEGFKKEFLRTFITQMHSSFNSDRCKYVLDSLAGAITAEVPYNQHKYGRTLANWQGYIDVLESQATSRYEFMPNYLESYFNFNSEKVMVTVDNNKINEGNVKVNDVLVQSYPINLSTYKEFELDIKAIPAKGYRFSHWENTDQTVHEQIVSTGSVWKYKDDASEYPTDWTIESFNDSSWNSGNAQLGYGDGDESTEIGYGSDASNKIATALFRKTVNLDDTTGITSVNLGITADDGAIVYLNNEEVYRTNMNSGSVSFNDYAAGTVQNENSMVFVKLNKNLIKQGKNTVACEVHQASGTSSDMSFDLSFSITKNIPSEEGIYSEIQELKSDTSFNLAIKPVFEPLEDLLDGIYINEIAAVSSAFRDEHDNKSGYIELFNSNSQDIYLNSCFLSDDEDWLDRYSIPDSTLIEAGGFVIFYADGNYQYGPLHATFKANKGGESLFLTQKLGSTMNMLDSMEYDKLYENYSYGKYADGTGDWLSMAVITPGEPNNPEELIVYSEPLSYEYDISIYPNPSESYFNLSVKDQNLSETNYYMDIIDISGKVVYPKVWLNSNTTNINTEILETGIYFVRIFKNINVVAVEKMIKMK